MILTVLKIILFNILVFSTMSYTDDWLYIAPNKKSLSSRKQNQRLELDPFNFQADLNAIMKRQPQRPVLDQRPPPRKSRLFECCPSVTDKIQPLGGVSKHGRILELFGTNTSRQSFYQTSCKEGVKGSWCKGISPNLRGYSTCTQRYSYTYAIVREFGAPQTVPWRLDYVRIRSGCTCELRLPTGERGHHSTIKDPPYIHN